MLSVFQRVVVTLLLLCRKNFRSLLEADIDAKPGLPIRSLNSD